MRESEFSLHIMQNLINNGAHPQRIETTTGSGIPDINACYQGVEFWIETKVVATLDGHPMLRPYQYAWIRNRLRHRGLIFVAAYYERHKMTHIWNMRTAVTRFDNKYHLVTSLPSHSNIGMGFPLSLLVTT